jgi:glycosyltransferase involved in cell wall biosynthesis
MIPAYNCITYLSETLSSVLAQDPGPEQMQIAVIDDCSTDGDVAALVQAIGKNRVSYYRQDSNVGSLRNFETCINRSTGEWVHILHGDDRVIKGFYSEIELLFTNHPEAGAAFTNTVNFTSSPTGEEVKIKPPIIQESGIIKDFLLMLAEGPQMETPSIVVKRAVYEQLGSFFAVHYGEDWEMWTRIAAHFPIAYSPKCLAEYRSLSNNGISHRFIREGQNIQDIIKVVSIIQNYLPVQHRKRLKKHALKHFALYCASLVDTFYYTDRQAALTQAKGAVRMSKDITVLYMSLKSYIRNAIKYKYYKNKLSNKIRKLTT